MSTWTLDWVRPSGRISHWCCETCSRSIYEHTGTMASAWISTTILPIFLPLCMNRNAFSSSDTLKTCKGWGTVILAARYNCTTAIVGLAWSIRIPRSTEANVAFWANGAPWAGLHATTEYQLCRAQRSDQMGAYKTMTQVDLRRWGNWELHRFPRWVAVAVQQRMRFNSRRCDPLVFHRFLQDIPSSRQFRPSQIRLLLAIFGELNDSLTDPSGYRMNQHRLPGLQTCGIE